MTEGNRRETRWPHEMRPYVLAAWDAAPTCWPREMRHYVHLLRFSLIG